MIVYNKQFKNDLIYLTKVSEIIDLFRSDKKDLTHFQDIKFKLIDIKNMLQY